MATETNNILHRSPMTRTENHTLWALLVVLALAVIGYAVYNAYYDNTVNTEYETSTIMGNTDRAPARTTITQ